MHLVHSLSGAKHGMWGPALGRTGCGCDVWEGQWFHRQTSVALPLCCSRSLIYVLNQQKNMAEGLSSVKVLQGFASWAKANEVATLQTAKGVDLHLHT